MLILSGMYNPDRKKVNYYRLSGDNTSILFEFRRESAKITHDRFQLKIHSESDTGADKFSEGVKGVYEAFKKIVDKASKDKLFVDISDFDSLEDIINPPEEEEGEESGNDDDSGVDTDSDDNGTEDDDKGTEDSDNEAVMP